MIRHRVITRTHWEGNHMVTQRFRVREQPFELVRVKERRRNWADVVFLTLAALLWCFACFLMTLKAVEAFR